MNQEDAWSRWVDALLTGEALAPVFGLGEAELIQIARLGVAAFGSRRYAQARRVFEAMARLTPSHYLPHHYLGLIAAAEGQPVVAAEGYRAALERIPSETSELSGVRRDLHLLLAGALHQLGQLEEAQASLQKLTGLTAVVAE